MDAPSVRYVTTPDGFDIAYAVSGEGRPVVLMPQPVNHIGIEWGSATYGPFLEAMSRRFRLIRYDDRGSGMSSRRLPAGFSAADYETDLGCVLDALGLHRAVLIGRITTGNVAVKYALAHSERVEAVVLWNTLRHYRDSFAHSHLDLARTHWEHVLRTAGEAYFPREDRSLGLEMARLAMEQTDFIRRVRAIASRYSIERDVTRLKAPVLVLASRTPGAGQEAQGLAAMIPGARLHLFGSGGGIVTEPGGEPAAVTTIGDFLASLDLQKAEAEPAPVRLSERELEVLRLVAAGMSNRQIACELVISSNTVARHLSNVFGKIRVANRAEATAYASRHRLI